jgi:hypothetical protein
MGDEKTITPNEQELKAAEWCFAHCRTLDEMVQGIAKHTRYKGMTAKDWYNLYLALSNQGANENKSTKQ